MHRLSLRLRVFLFFTALGLGSVGIAAAGPLARLPSGRRPRLALPHGGHRGGLRHPRADLRHLASLRRERGQAARTAGRRPARAGARRRHPRSRRGRGPLSRRSGPGGGGDVEAAVDATLGAAETVAQRTAELAFEARQLTEILTDIPLAVMMVNAADQIVLYDGQSADAPPSRGAGPPQRLALRLPEGGPVRAALAELDRSERRRVPLVAETRSGRFFSGHSAGPSARARATC
jgi:DNA polymerase III subunit epsilon